MSRLQQDTFIDEEEEVCPLCVEEFDFQDRNFKPCPCGYQICQFCFNNIRTNLNGLCPACRRPYREETIEYKVITVEEYKAEDSKRKRIANEKRKHEAQKREIEALNRKHLSGLRVIQRNLVYVTGLNPRIREEELLATLRGDQYFGQYGKILKIVVNKRTAQGGPSTLHNNNNNSNNNNNNNNNHHDYNSQGLGVYVTFSNKNEAEKCIAAVDGSQNGDRTLRATYGTTKYCSAYLRNEMCPNKNCMFLHEPGEEAESFSRMELSTANSRQTKDQAHSHTARPAITTRENQPPPGHNEATSMARTNSHAGGDGDGPSALPSTANWAKNPATPATRPASLVHQVSNQKASPTMPSPPLVQTVQTVKKVVSERVKSSSTPSSSSSDNANGKSVGIIGQGAPCASVAVPAVESAPSSASISTSQQQSPSKSKPTQPTMPAYMAEQMERLQKIHKAISDPNFIFVLSSRAFSPDEHDALRKIPHMFDQHGGKKRRELLEKIKNQQLAESGTSDDASRGEPSQQPPIGTVGALGSISLAGIPSRGLTPLQQQQRDGAGQHHQVLQGLGALQQEALQQQQQAALRTQTPQGLLHQTPGQQTFGGAFQNGQGSMAPPQPSQHQPGHARQSSRYTFANENPLSTATSVNPRGNAAHMAEQVRMMPTQPIPHQQLSQIYGGAPGLGGALLGSMQQPPPGLKNAPTPPAPGLGGIPMGNMPGLGQFSGMGLGGHHGKSDSDNQLIRELMAGKNASRLGNASGVSLMRGGDGKLDLGDPSILQARVAQPQHQMQHQPGIQGGHSQQGSRLNFAPLSGPAISTPGPSTTSAKPSQAPAISTPGASETDFPALTPVPPVVKVMAPKTSKIFGKKKDKKTKAGSGAAESEPMVEEAVGEGITNNTSEEQPVIVMPIAIKKDAAKEKVRDKAKGKAKQELDSSQIDTAPSRENLREGGKDELATKVDVRAYVPYEPQSQSLASASALTSSSKKGPLMMRIVSKDNTTSGFDSPNVGNFNSSRLEGTHIVSETASVATSESRSRTPPIAIETVKKKKDLPVTGPALADMPPVPVKSKSALKKERIAAMKEKERIEAEEAAAVKAKDVQAPIVGRMKKKEKKGGVSNKKPGDHQYEADDVHSERGDDNASVTSRTQAETPSISATTPTIINDDIKKGTVIAASTATAAEDSVERDDQKSTNITAAQIIAEIQSEGSIDFKDLEMFKTITGLKWEHHITSEELQKIRAGIPPPTITPLDGPTVASPPELNDASRARVTPSIKMAPGSSAGSVHFSFRGGGTFESRMLVTPQGSVLRGLTPEQEKRYLELEERRIKERNYEHWNGKNSANSGDPWSTLSSPIPRSVIERAMFAAELASGSNPSSSGGGGDTKVDWKAAVTAHTMAAGLAAAGSVARNMHLGPEEAARLSTKEALEYLWNTVMPALPGYAQEHLEGLAQNMAMGGYKVSVGFDGGSGSSSVHGLGQAGGDEPTVTVDVKVDTISRHKKKPLENLSSSATIATSTVADGANPSTTTASAITSTGGRKSIYLDPRELEKMVTQARKETEVLEKKIEKLIKRNRKIVGLV